MTVPATTRRAGPFTGNGVTTGFPFAFKVFTTADLAVVRASDGVENTLALGTDYTVSLNPDQDTSPGGTVNLTAALASGDTLAIVGDIDYDQQLDLPGGGAFRPLALENALDRTVIQIQQLREEVERTLRVPVTSDADIELPTPESNKLIGWDSGATGLQNYDVVDLVSAQLYADWTYDTFNGDGTSTAFALDRAPGALGNIDVSIDGVSQVPGVDYAVSGSTLTFSSAPPNGTEILARYGSSAVQGVLGFTTEYQTATAGQTIFNLTLGTYVPGGGALKVYVNGLAVRGGVDYLETNASRVTFTAGLTEGDEVRFEIGGTVSDAIDAANVGWTGSSGRLARSLASKAEDVLSVKDFGAVGDGSTDDTAAINAALAAAGALSGTGRGVVVYFPGGAYRVTSTLTVNKSHITLVGDGRFASTFVVGTQGLTVVNFDLGTGGTIFYGGIKSMGFRATTSLTSGVFVRAYNGTGLVFDDIHAQGWYEGFDLIGTARCYLSRLTGNQAGRTSGKALHFIELRGDAAVGYSTGNHITDVEITSNSAVTGPYETGIRLNGVDGLYVSQYHATDGDYDLIVQPDNLAGANDRCASIRFVNSYFDACEIGNIDLRGTCDAYRDIGFSNCVVRAGKTFLIRTNTTSTVNYVTFSGCTIRDIQINGLEMANANVGSLQVNDCTFVRSTSVSTNTGDDVIVRGTNTRLSNNRFVGGNTTNNNIRLISTAVRPHIESNDWSQSLAATPLRVDASAANGFVIRDNVEHGQMAFLRRNLTATTVDATPVTVWTYTLAQDEAIDLDVDAFGMSAGVSSGTSVRKKATYFKDGAAAPALIGAQTTIHEVESAVGYSVAISVSGDAVQVVLTGIALSTLTWSVIVQAHIRRV